MAVVRIETQYGFLDYRDGSGGTIEILDLHVDAAYRRRGLASSFIGKLLDIAKERSNCPLVWAITRADNFIAQEFYERTKFRIVAPLRSFYGDRTPSGNKTIDAVMYGRCPEDLI